LSGFELRCQDLVKSLNVRVLHRIDEILIERRQLVDIIAHARLPRYSSNSLRALIRQSRKLQTDLK
jgi:ribosomal protein S24E